MREQQSESPSYHDVYVTTSTMKRTAISDLPFGYELTCNRVGGWTLWGPHDEQLANRVGPFPADAPAYLKGPKKIASEYGPGLRIDVAGHVICDSLSRKV